MPPRARGRAGAGASGPTAAGSSSAAASSPDGPSTSGRPAAPAPLLPESLGASLKALPTLADAVLGAPTQQGAGRSGPAFQPDLDKMCDVGKHLCNVADDIEDLLQHSAPHAAAMAELLSTHAAGAAAVLKLQAAALRSSGGGDEAAAEGEEADTLRKAMRKAVTTVEALAARVWMAFGLALPPKILGAASPLPPSHHALSVLRFAQAMLRADTLPALSRRLAAAAAALEPAAGGAGSDGGGAGGMNSAGGGGGKGTGGSGRGSSGGGGDSSGGGGGSSGGRSGGGGGGRGRSDDAGALAEAGGALDCFASHCSELAFFLLHKSTAPHLASAAAGATSRAPSADAAADEVAALLAACAQEFARRLADSGLLEHAARALLLLQARGPQAVRDPNQGKDNPASTVLGSIRILFKAAGIADSGISSLAGATRMYAVPPAAAVHLRSALRGPSVRTAVLVYGVGALRLIDGGPCYGLPSALQTAGLSLRSPDGDRALDPVDLSLLLSLLSSGVAVPPLGPGASLELALRVGRAAAGTVAAGQPAGDASTSRLVSQPPRAVLLAFNPREAARMAVEVLQCGRLLLQRRRGASPLLERQREEWWRLAVRALGLPPAPGLWELVTSPVLAVWPEGRLDLDALPPAAPPELAVALAAGLLPAVSGLLGIGCPPPASQPGGGLSDADDWACPDGAIDWALVLTPLLAYGEEGQGAELVRTLGQLGGLGGSGSASAEPHRPVAVSLVSSLDEALQSCRVNGSGGAAAITAAGVAVAPADPDTAGPAAGTAVTDASASAPSPSAGPSAGAAPASAPGPSADAATSAPGPSAADAAATSAAMPAPGAPLQQLRRLVALAPEAWGLGPVGSTGPEAQGAGRVGA